MMKIVTKKIGKTLNLELIGSLTEKEAFKDLDLTGINRLIVNTKRVDRITSHGIKNWIAFFQLMTPRGISVSLVHCSPPIVDQLNLIVNFKCDATIDSIRVPFTCQKCKAQLYGTLDGSKLKDWKNSIGEQACSQCDGKAVFDDLPEEYFRFLK